MLLLINIVLHIGVFKGNVKIMMNKHKKEVCVSVVANSEAEQSAVKDI